MKNYCQIWNQRTPICLINLRPEMPDFGYLRAKIWKKTCYIWNQCPTICLVGKFRTRIKCLNLGPKIPYLSIFWKVKQHGGWVEKKALVIKKSVYHVIKSSLWKWIKIKIKITNVIDESNAQLCLIFFQSCVLTSFQKGLMVIF